MSQPTRKCYATRRAAAVAPDLACSESKVVAKEFLKFSLLTHTPVLVLMISKSEPTWKIPSQGF